MPVAEKLVLLGALPLAISAQTPGLGVLRSFSSLSLDGSAQAVASDDADDDDDDEANAVVAW